MLKSLRHTKMITKLTTFFTGLERLMMYVFIKYFSFSFIYKSRETSCFSFLQKSSSALQNVRNWRYTGHLAPLLQTVSIAWSGIIITFFSFLRVIHLIERTNRCATFKIAAILRFRDARIVRNDGRSAFKNCSNKRKRLITNCVWRIGGKKRGGDNKSFGEQSFVAESYWR